MLGLAQARRNARFFAQFGVVLSPDKIAIMADLLDRAREGWTTEAKRAANIRAKQRKRRLSRRKTRCQKR